MSLSLFSYNDRSTRWTTTRTPPRRIVGVLVSLVLLLLLVREARASSMALQVSSKSSPFCSGALTLSSVQVACGGTNGECYFGTKIRVYGSILANKQVTTSATLGVTAYIDGLVSRDLGYTDDVNLCSFVTSTYDDETCPSAGLYQFDFSYTIPYLEDSSGWWFGYNNKIGVNVDVTDSETDGTKFAATCHMVLVVTDLSSSNSSSSSSRQSRILYWSLLGLAAMTGGFYIGYSVRRRCRVVCLEDLNCMGGGEDEDAEEDAVVKESASIASHSKNSNATKKPKKKTWDILDPVEEIIVHTADFEIMQDHPVARTGFVPTVQCKLLQPPGRKQPLLNQMEHMESVGVQV